MGIETLFGYVGVVEELLMIWSCCHSLFLLLWVCIIFGI